MFCRLYRRLLPRDCIERMPGDLRSSSTRVVGVQITTLHMKTIEITKKKHCFVSTKSAQQQRVSEQFVINKPTIKDTHFLRQLDLVSEFLCQRNFMLSDLIKFHVTNNSCKYRY